MTRGAWGEPALLAGGLIVLGFAAFALAGPLLWPVDPFVQELARRMVPPPGLGGDWVHPLGTDGFGRDMLARLMMGVRMSLAISVGATALAGAIGTTLGVAGGFFGGRIDAAVMFVLTVRLAIPVVLVALAVATISGTSTALLTAVLGLLVWDRFAVVLRGAAQQLRGRDHIEAARAVGCTTARILLRHVLPNLAPQLIVVATIEIGHVMLLEAALSFLGLGVPPPTPSLGLMVADGRAMMALRPWLIGIPGGALFVLLLGINLLGDGLRDALAPTRRPA
jgi:peptide/nickel transport system permease protein